MLLEMAKHKLKKEKGVTLVALVITIIVLIILAGITLTVALKDDNGIVSRTNETKFKSEMSELKRAIDEQIISTETITLQSSGSDEIISDALVKIDLDDSLKNELKENLTIQDEELVYRSSISLSDDEKAWLQEVGINQEATSDVTSTDDFQLIFNVSNAGDIEVTDTNNITWYSKANVEITSSATINADDKIQYFLSNEISTKGDAEKLLPGEWLNYSGEFVIDHKTNIFAKVVNNEGKTISDIFVYGDDGNGNGNNVAIDTESPEIGFVTNEDETWRRWNRTDVNITDDSGTVSLVKYKWVESNIEDVKYDASDSSWVETLPEIGRNGETGIYKLWVYAEDVFGHKQTYSSGEFCIDNEAPSVPNISLKTEDGNIYNQDTWTNQDVIVTLQASDEHSGVYGYQYSIDGGTNWSDITLADANGLGTITLEGGEDKSGNPVKEMNRDNIVFRTIDNAKVGPGENGYPNQNDGNKSNESDWYHVKIDRTAPEITLSPDTGKFVIGTGKTDAEIQTAKPKVKDPEIADDTKVDSKNGSGIDTTKLKYAWFNESGEQLTDWKNYKSGSKIEEDRFGIGIYYLHLQAGDNAGNIVTFVSGAYEVISGEGAIQISHEPTEWTNGNVTITVTFDSVFTKGKLVGYGLTERDAYNDRKTNSIANSVSLYTRIVETNGYVYVEAKDSASNLVRVGYHNIDGDEYPIEKIDKLTPEVSLSITEVKKYKTVKIKAVATDKSKTAEYGCSGIAAYMFTQSSDAPDINSEEWIDAGTQKGNQSATFESGEITENGTWYFWVKDQAGNINDGSDNKNKVDIIDQIDNEIPTDLNIEAKLNNASGANYDSSWTNQNVYVKLTATDNFGIDRYEWYENGNWTTRALSTTNSGNATDSYGAITYKVSRNQTLRFRVVDLAGNVSEEKTLLVKIDKDKPKVTKLTSDNGTISVKLTAEANDIGSSGIQYYQITNNSTIPSNDSDWKELDSVKEDESVITITPDDEIKKNGTYYFWVKDQVGNISDQRSIVVDTIDEEDPWSIVDPGEGEVRVDQFLVIAPPTGFYPENTEVTIVIRFNEKIKGTAPTLKIKFGNGDVRAISEGIIQNEGINGIEDSNGKKYPVIVYKYTIQNGDNGALALVSWGENETIDITDLAGNKFEKAEKIILTGEKITADTTVPTVKFSPDGGNAIMPSEGNATISSTARIDDVTSGVNLSSISYGWSNSESEEPTEWTSEELQDVIVNKDDCVPGSYYLWIKAADNVGNSTIVHSEEYVVNNIENAIEIAFSNEINGEEQWTNQDVKATISYSSDLDDKEVDKQVSVSGTDGVNYKELTENGVTLITNNTNVTAILTDNFGNKLQNSKEVTKIDKLNPIIDYLSKIDVEQNKKIKIEAIVTDQVATTTNGCSGISAYMFTQSSDLPDVNSTEWIDAGTQKGNQSATFYSDDITDNGTWYFWVKDQAGNINESDGTNNKIDIGEIDNEAPENLTIEARLNNENGEAYDSSWTNQNVYVKLTAADNVGIDHYEWYENNNWTTRDLDTKDEIGEIKYTAPRNQTLRFRAVDAVGNVSEEKTLLVKIDTKAPEVISLTSDSGTSRVKLTAIARDTSSVLSGIQYYAVTKENTQPSEGWQEISEVKEDGSNITINTEIEENGTYYFWVKDQAGNINDKSESIIINTIDVEVPILQNNTIMVTSPDTGIYKKDTEVTFVATFSENIKGTVPTLKIKFGTGTERTISVGTISNDTITYKYTIQDGDNGILSLVSYTGGAITDFSNNAFVIPDGIILGGNEITADTLAPTVRFYPDGGTAIMPSEGNATISSTARIEEERSGLDLSSIVYGWSSSDTEEPSNWTEVSYTEEQSTWNEIMSRDISAEKDDCVNGSYYLWIKAVDNVGNSTIVHSKEYVVKSIDSAISITLSNEKDGEEQWTNQDVKATIKYNSNISNISGLMKNVSCSGDSDGYVIESDTEVIVKEKNIEVNASLTDIFGNSVTTSKTVTKIDKISPTAYFTINGGTAYKATNEDDTKINTTVIPGDEGGSGILSKKYLWIDGDLGEEFDPYTLTFEDELSGDGFIERVGIDWDIDYYLVVEIIDNAGNRTVEISENFHIIDSESAIEISLEPLEWTNQEVIATITYQDELLNREAGYGVDIDTAKQKVISTTAEKVVVQQNGYVAATAQDDFGNTVWATKEVTNIDKTAPQITISPDGTENTYTKSNGLNVEVSITETGSGILYEAEGNSGFYYKWIEEGEDIPTTFEDFEGETLEASGNEISKPEKDGVFKSGIFRVYVYTKDNAGNEAIVGSNKFYLDNTGPEIIIKGIQDDTGEYIGEVTISLSDEHAGIEGDCITIGGDDITSGSILTNENYADGEYNITGWDKLNNNTTKTIRLASTKNIPISTQEQLYYIGDSTHKEMINGYRCTFYNTTEYTYYLTNDIEVSGDWLTIGSRSFSTVLDGNNYSLKKLAIRENENSIGMFSEIDNGTIKNLVLENPILTTNDIVYGARIGFLAGYAYNATIQNVHIKDGYMAFSKETQKIETESYVGGIIGECDETKISQSSFEGILTLDYDYADERLFIGGGLCGYMSGGTIVQSYNRGKLMHFGTIGGIVGYGYALTIRECYNIGNIENSGAPGISGGIIGEISNFSQSNINDCFNNGTISSSTCGGIVGTAEDISTQITDCYNSGVLLSSSNTIYSIAKFNIGDGLINCYAYNNYNNENDNNSSSEELKTLNFDDALDYKMYLNFNFEDVWEKPVKENETIGYMPSLSFNPEDIMIYKETDIVISSPSKQYVKQGDTFTYRITTTNSINISDLEVNVVEDGTTGGTSYVQAADNSGKVFTVTVTAGSSNGTLGIIATYNGKSVTSSKVTVDNTVPKITIENSTTRWVKSGTEVEFTVFIEEKNLGQINLINSNFKLELYDKEGNQVEYYDNLQYTVEKELDTKYKITLVTPIVDSSIDSADFSIVSGAIIDLAGNKSSSCQADGFQIDNQGPSIQLESKEGSITVLSIEDDGSGVKADTLKYVEGYITNVEELKNSSNTYSKGTVINVSNSGYYTFYAEDNVGNYTIKQVEVYAIEIINPLTSTYEKISEEEYVYYDGDWTNNDLYFSLNSYETGYTYTYRIGIEDENSNSNGEEYLWIKSGDIKEENQKVLLLENSWVGTIHIEITAKYLGKSDSMLHSVDVRIDKQEPEVTVDLNNVTDTSIEAKINVKDSLSGPLYGQEYYYQLTNEGDLPKENSWTRVLGSLSSDTWISNSIYINANNSQNQTLWVKSGNDGGNIYDKAGNSTNGYVYVTDVYFENNKLDYEYTVLDNDYLNNEAFLDGKTLEIKETERTAEFTLSLYENGESAQIYNYIAPSVEKLDYYVGVDHNGTTEPKEWCIKLKSGNVIWYLKDKYNSGLDNYYYTEDELYKKSFLYNEEYEEVNVQIRDFIEVYDASTNENITEDVNICFSNQPELRTLWLYEEDISQTIDTLYLEASQNKFRISINGKDNLNSIPIRVVIKAGAFRSGSYNSGYYYSDTIELHGTLPSATSLDLKISSPTPNPITASGTTATATNTTTYTVTLPEKDGKTVNMDKDHVKVVLSDEMLNANIEYNIIKESENVYKVQVTAKEGTSRGLFRIEIKEGAVTLGDAKSGKIVSAYTTVKSTGSLVIPYGGYIVGGNIEDGLVISDSESDAYAWCVGHGWLNGEPDSNDALSGEEYTLIGTRTISGTTEYLYSVNNVGTHFADDYNGFTAQSPLQGNQYVWVPAELDDSLIELIESNDVGGIDNVQSLEIQRTGQNEGTITYTVTTINGDKVTSNVGYNRTTDLYQYTIHAEIYEELWRRAPIVASITDTLSADKVKCLYNYGGYYIGRYDVRSDDNSIYSSNIGVTMARGKEIDVSYNNGESVVSRLNSNMNFNSSSIYLANGCEIDLVLNRDIFDKNDDGEFVLNDNGEKYTPEGIYIQRDYYCFSEKAGNMINNIYGFSSISNIWQDESMKATGLDTNMVERRGFLRDRYSPQGTNKLRTVLYVQ